MCRICPTLIQQILQLSGKPLRGRQAAAQTRVEEGYVKRRGCAV